MKKEDQKVVSDFINCFKLQEKEKLSNKFSFPLNREYPIPEIKNKQDFLNRYNEVFDDSLIKMIINSKPSRDWSSMESEGIMLLNGQLWLDEEGNLIAVNYQSKAERKKRDELIEKEKIDLHESIQEFKKPVKILETAKYRIRIDKLGNENYRYASWPIQKKMSDKPDLVLENGKFIRDGSGGNHSYEFSNKDYTYECSIIVMGEESSPPALLTIYKGEKEILSQKAKIVKK